MTAEERSENSWRIAVTEMHLANGQLKEKKLKGMTNVSVGQLQNFRKAYKKIMEAKEDPLTISWKQAYAKLKACEEPYEHEEEDPWERAEFILSKVWKLTPNMLTQIQRQPEVLVAIIQLIAGSNIRFVASHLFHDLEFYLDNDDEDF